MAALVAGCMTSCEDAPAVAPIQENPQGHVISTEDVTVTTDAPSAINLDDLGLDGSVNLFTISTAALPENLELSPKVQVSDDSEFSDNVVELPVAYQDGVVSASAMDWHMADMDLFGDDINANTVYYRLLADVTNTTTGATYGFGQPDQALASGSASVTPMVSQMVIETNVVKTPGSYNGWNADASQYLYCVKNDGVDTNEYVGSVLLSGEGFKFYTINGDWIGCDPENLGTTGGSNIAPTDGDGLYWATINLDTNTYTLTKINQIGMIGSMNGWGGDIDLTPNADQTVWTGEATLDGEWKLRMNGNWDINYGGALLNPSFNGSNFNTKGNATVTINFAGHHPVIKVKTK